MFNILPLDRFSLIYRGNICRELTKLAEIKVFFFDRIENIVGRRENVDISIFLYSKFCLETFYLTAF